MPYYIQTRPVYANELYHHGIKGQRWGVRRYQNPDGTLTAAGKTRYYRTAKKNWRDIEVRSSATGSIYEQTLKDSAEKETQLSKYTGKNHININNLTEIDKHDSKLARKMADLADAKNTEKFWKNQNESVKKEMQSYKATIDKTLKEYGNKQLKDLPTKTLSNGEEIVNGRVLTAGEVAQAMALTLASFGTAMAGAPFIMVAIPDPKKKIRRHRYITEKENNFDKWEYRNKTKRAIKAAKGKL